MSQNKEPQHIKLDERNHVEKSLLDPLTGKVRGKPFLTKPQEISA
jgi:hypothetical protein